MFLDHYFLLIITGFITQIVLFSPILNNNTFTILKEDNILLMEGSTYLSISEMAQCEMSVVLNTVT